MRKLLIPLLATLVLPTSVNAETWWLLVRGKRLGSEPVVAWEMPTTSEKNAKLQKQRFLIVKIGKDINQKTLSPQLFV